MAKRVQRYGVTSTVMAALVGLARELVVNTTNNSVHVHDGATVGGFELGRADASNIVEATATNNGAMTTTQVAQLTTNTADIASLDSRVTVNEGDISTLQSDVTGKLDVIGSPVAKRAVSVTAGGQLQQESVSLDTSYAAGAFVIALPGGAATAMLFWQAAAPTGWTKSTANNNKALRVVSGTGGGTGGSVAFTTAFASKTPSGTISNESSHTHGAGSYGVSLQRGRYDDASGDYRPFVAGLADSSGSIGGFETKAVSGTSAAGSAHNHTFTGVAINLAVQYLDVIVCTKD